MRQRWLERMLDVVADRGRDLLKLGGNSAPPLAKADLCRRILAGQGEASGIALSRELLRQYSEDSAEGRLAFFALLAGEFGPDREAIKAASAGYAKSGSLEDFLALSSAVEPPRQELFRRLNMAPNGTAALVAMRADLLGLLRQHPELRGVDADLKHLLASWFNRGFLQLRSIDWSSPARVLEKLITYEAVHEIRGWGDLQRRLLDDRRCFAFFHPAMPEEPLIFVEVALVSGMAERVQPLLDPAAPVQDPGAADTAMFYSINNTQVGLRGISFGNFLIKQVVAELSAEFPQLSRFATLSPMPRFASTLRAAVEGTAAGLSLAQLDAVLGDHAQALCDAAGTESPARALLQLLEGDPLADPELVAEPLTQVALLYLSSRGPKGAMLDPVAAFHLANGARLERINLHGDVSAHGRAGSFGVMVNYLYLPEELEANHERFVGAGEVVMAKPLARLQRRNAAALASLAQAS